MLPDPFAMPVDIRTEIVINRPRDDVFEYSCNPDNVPIWYKNIKSVEWLSERPIEQGSQIAFVAEFLGRTLKYSYEITELVPQEKLVMRTSEGPFPMETSYAFTPVENDHTLMTMRNRGEPSGFSRWVAPFMSIAMRRANMKDLRLLKSTLEQET